MHSLDSSHASAALPAEALQSATIRKVLRPQGSLPVPILQHLIVPLILAGDAYTPFNTSLVSPIF